MHEDKKFLELSKKICCIECGSSVKYFPLKKRTGIYLCSKCHNVNLVENNIFFFLPKKYDNKTVYEKFLMKYNSFLKDSPKKIYRYLLNKVKSLPDERDLKWEDEDVLFWNNIYKSNYQQIVSDNNSSKIGGIRSITRDKVLFSYLRNTDYEDKFLLEIGCGESFTIRTLFSPLRYHYNYIASDYSYWALRYAQKMLGNSKNTFYFQCPAHLLPFKVNSLDYIVCLGVLHHMPEKERHLPTIIEKIKPKGLLISNEAYDRDASVPPIFSNMVNKFIEPEKSAHEERINWQRTRSILVRKGRLISEEHEYSPTRTLLVRLFGSLLNDSKLAIDLSIFLDKLTINTIGRIWSLFGPGSVLFILQKDD